MEKVRVNMYLPKDLKDWYWVEAEKQGFNFTTMVQVAMLSYKKEQEALELSKLIDIVNGLKDGQSFDFNSKAVVEE